MTVTYIEYKDITRNKLTVERSPNGVFDVRIKIKNSETEDNKERVINMCNIVKNIIIMYMNEDLNRVKGTFKLSKRTGLFKLKMRKENTKDRKAKRPTILEMVEGDIPTFFPLKVK